MSWIRDIADPRNRRWEDFYRNRWQHDKVVRSTHGVNCTGSCSWMVHVKNGIVSWELQAKDYPPLAGDIPPYEPRGCQRGISTSWYLYSPIRVKYPYVRGTLLDLWNKAREQHEDPVDAWASIVNNAESRRSHQRARGKGGFRRSSWEVVLEIIAASAIHTTKQHGPDRIIGFSPIPAMSMLSYAGGSRFLQLLGGVNLSFYDWYSDLPPASPEVWGEQTDVAESADWYNSKYIVVMGSNLGMTRTPDVHFVAEARHNGSKLVVLSPDFSMVSKYADWWIPANAGQDGAFWMAVNHVILREFFHEKRTPFFEEYLKRYSDAPFLVTMASNSDPPAGTGGSENLRFLRAATLPRYREAENADWKLLVWDDASGAPRSPQGSIGYRWQHQKGQWNLEMKDGLDGQDLSPRLSMLGIHDGVVEMEVADFDNERTVRRGVPVKYIDAEGRRIAVATVFDLLMAQFGVDRGLAGRYPAGYEDDTLPYTPAWQEKFTGIDRKTVLQFAREFASTAEKTEGRCSIIIGAGVNHWYHNNLMYRAGITGLILCGCVGRNGGGLNHYVGQEKLAPMAPWSMLAFALDWGKPPRLQNTPSFHYVHSCQWRYERGFEEYNSPLASSGEDGAGRLTHGHTMDLQAKAVRMGWLPFFPQFNQNPLEIVREAEESGAKEPDEICRWVAERLRKGELRFAIDDPDAPENWPRLWLIWRGNALMSSAKGHEYFLRHYLGTHDNLVAKEAAHDSVSEVAWRQPAPEGKLDLVVDMNFRMDTSALYSDIVLPAATWYEKDDLSSTDMHSYIHPLSAAVPPCWESRSDWDIFRAIAERFSDLARKHFPGKVRDLVATPLMHDTPAELAQPVVKDWKRGECDAVPGKTMPNLSIVERDYGNLYRRFVSFGPVARKEGIGFHGLSWPVADLYDELAQRRPAAEWDGRSYPSVAEAVDAANLLLHLAPETNGESAYRAFQAEEKKVGLPLADLAEGVREVRYTFEDLSRQPRRVLASPIWTGIPQKGRAYSAYCLNVDRLVPWRTLTGRQHFYLDHQGYLAFKEHLPTFKPNPDPRAMGDIDQSGPQGKSVLLNYLTPHGKWHIHSTFSDNERMLTLSRGIEPLWMNDRDAMDAEIRDNDWVELYNDHGVMVTRAVVSARLPRGMCMLYHSPERTLTVPRSPLRGNRRAGGHNSLNRIRLKPVLMMGGYAQFTYAFNYWGPTGVNRDTFVHVRKLPGAPTW